MIVGRTAAPGDGEPHRMAAQPKQPEPEQNNVDEERGELEDARDRPRL